jgi:hypothetical protein
MPGLIKGAMPLARRADDQGRETVSPSRVPPIRGRSFSS